MWLSLKFEYIFCISLLSIYSVINYIAFLTIIGFRSKYPVNEDYFEDINTKEKAYWLGVLYADGAINKNNSVRLGMKDKDHIEKFKKAIGAINHKIGVTIDKRFTHESECYYISIKSKKINIDYNIIHLY